MIDRILEQQQAISAVLANDRKNWHHMPTDQEFSVLKTVVSVLKPLLVFIDALFGEKTPHHFCSASSSKAYLR